MKRFRAASLVVLIFSLVAGCGPNGNTNNNNEVVDLTQRTGVPFQVREATQNTLPLLAIMVNLEHNMAVLQAGIWRGEYQTISEAARALVNHEKIPEQEIQKIRSILGDEGLQGFVAADQDWHDTAVELAEAADDKKMKLIVNRTAELIQQCSNCHLTYRERLRESPKWLEGR